jgi:hypothetical protein
MRTKKMAARLPIFVCALALVGCASSGKETKDSQLAQFQKGVTTENEVLRTLGPPTATTFNSDGSVVLVYMGGHAQIRAASFAPVVVVFAGGATADATSVAFRFGPDHRLTELQPSATPGSSHVRLGVHCTQVTVAFAQRYHLPNENYVRVATLEAGSVAEAGGIRVGDLLLKYGDRSLSEISDLAAAIAATPKGAGVPITVWRRTRESVVQVQY